MSGPQFAHVQSYSRKSNGGGQSVRQILAEAERDPQYSDHVKEPQPPNVIFGVSPSKVQELHDQMLDRAAIEVNLKNGKVAKRGIRKDRHTLLTVVASYPLLSDQVLEGSPDRENYQSWIELNLAWLKKRFGSQLISVIEHTDEKHPHLHAYVLPMDDPECYARNLNPAWAAKSEAEARAKKAGHTPKVALKLGNRAYRARGREWQDDYFKEVGLPAGLTRSGPKRERLSRQQWKARKEEARRSAELLREMDQRIETLAVNEDDQEEALKKLAGEAIARLDEAEAVFNEAEQLKADAAHAAASLREEALREAEEATHRKTEALRVREDRISKDERRLADAQAKFEREKAGLRFKAVREAARATVRVIIGAMKGSVTLSDDGYQLNIADPDLAQTIERLEISTLLATVAKGILTVWDRLKAHLSAPELAVEQERVNQALNPLRDLGDKGIEP
jgi:hypothetical protein